MVVLERIVVRVHGCSAILLRGIVAVRACAATVHHAPYADGHACSKVFDICTDRHNAADNLMAGNHGKFRWTPFFVDLVDVRVADAGEQDFDGNVVGTGGAAGDCVRDERALAC